MDAVITDNKTQVTRDTDGAGGTLFALLNELGKPPTHALVINDSTKKLETWALETTTFAGSKARGKKADTPTGDDSDDGKKTEDAG